MFIEITLHSRSIFWKNSAMRATKFQKKERGKPEYNGSGDDEEDRKQGR